jgi:hypothetical protein
VSRARCVGIDVGLKLTGGYYKDSRKTQGRWDGGIRSAKEGKAVRWGPRTGCWCLEDGDLTRLAACGGDARCRWCVEWVGLCLSRGICVECVSVV